MRKLPVIKIMVGAFYYPWMLRKPLFKALSILIAAGVVLSSAWWYTKEDAPEYLGWGVMILYWTLYTLFAVICHRIVLLGSGSVPEYGVTRVGARDFHFALALVKITLISSLAVAAGSLVVQLPAWIFGAPAASGTLKAEILSEYLLWMASLIQVFILSRFGFILPATAIDQRPTLRWAWQASRGNALRLMLVLALLPWLASLPLTLFPNDVGILGYGFYIFIWWLLLPIEITVLSLSYKELTQEHLII